MSIEGPNQEGHQEKSTEELEIEINSFLLNGQTEEALDLIERSLEGENKYYWTAEVGRTLVESGELDKAQEIADLLEENEESEMYAGGVLELIMKERGEL